MQAHLADSDDEDGTEVDENSSKFSLGLVDVNVIGMQCYNGRVSDFKMMQLIQERQRPDDVFDVLPLCLMKKQLRHNSKSGIMMTDYRQMFASKNRNHCRENREYCGLSSQSTQQGGTADMYSMLHNSRCVCLCPTRPLFSSLWPIYNQGDTVWPKWHHHCLLALSANYNPLERWWKSFEILEYKSASKSWVIVTKMPDKIVNALFQVKSFNVVHAASHESRIIIKRMGDGQINGVVYDLDKDAWSTDWIVPVNAVAWFRGIYPIQELCVPWEKYMTKCHTYIAPERRTGKKMKIPTT